MSAANQKELTKKEATCPAILPLVDIYETDNEYTLKMEVPGVQKDDVDVTLNDNELQVKAWVASREHEQREPLYREFDAESYERNFRVGNDIDRNGIEAELSNGVLTLRLQKSEEVKPKKIQINAK
jgi:HSP20 family molecular chaperone IbpA